MDEFIEVSRTRSEHENLNLRLREHAPERPPMQLWNVNGDMRSVGSGGGGGVGAAV